MTVIGLASCLSISASNSVRASFVQSLTSEATNVLHISGDQLRVRVAPTLIAVDVQGKITFASEGEVGRNTIGALLDSLVSQQRSSR
jgi:hypothetical protein